MKLIDAQQVTCSEVLSHVQSMFTASHGISSSGPETRQINSPQLIITSTNRKRLRLPKTLNGAEENVKEEVWGCYKMEEG